LVFAAMNLLGVLIAYYAKKSPINTNSINTQGALDFIIGAFIVIPLLLFLLGASTKAKGG